MQNEGWKGVYGPQTNDPEFNKLELEVQEAQQSFENEMALEKEYQPDAAYQRYQNIGIPMEDRYREKRDAFNAYATEKQEAERRAWNVEALVDVQDMEPSEFHPERKWMATKYKVKHADGSFEEIASNTPVLRMNSESNGTIEVPAFAAHHIMSLHLKGEEAGGVMQVKNLEEAFGVLAKHLPEQIPFKGDSASIEVDVGQVVGTEGVTSQQEMLEKGICTEQDVVALRGAKEDVFRLNLKSTAEEKEAFVNAFNAKMSGNVKLGVRAGAITPFYSTERQPTSKLFLVLGQERTENGETHASVVTLTSGRYMDKLPADRSFGGRPAAEGTEGAPSVGELWEKLHQGELLKPEELELVKAQRKAQECWWDGGFIIPPEKKD